MGGIYSRALRGLIHETRDTLASGGLIYMTSDVTPIRLMHGICDTLTIRRVKSETFDSLAPDDYHTRYVIGLL